ERVEPPGGDLLTDVVVGGFSRSDQPRLELQKEHGVVGAGKDLPVELEETVVHRVETTRQALRGQVHVSRLRFRQPLEQRRTRATPEIEVEDLLTSKLQPSRRERGTPRRFGGRYGEGSVLLLDPQAHMAADVDHH